ncbi:MAG TPA: HAMP domain-containing sensor histidine kinase [Chloroflexia bacterium]|nr:HAMP domain-containing sensor histidine kinase [Chloroflexia bacterium]
MLISLRWRLFASYFAIIIVGVITLFATASLIAGAFFQADIKTILAEKGNSEAGVEALNAAFNSGVHNSLLVAAVASLLAALVISIFVSGRLSQPLHEMIIAANRIASGHYEEKVKAPSVKEVAELAAAFNQMAISLEHNERLRRELVSDLAHELRTPLTAIEGYMEGLIDGVLEPTPATFGRVQREARRLHRLAQELGRLSEIDSPVLKLKLEKVAAREVIEEVVSKVHPQFEFKGITLEVSPPAEPNGPLYVKADNDRLEQILINLLANALHYTDTGGHVRLSTRLIADRVEFTIQDTGIGIAEENLPYVFERFYRVDKSRSRHGNTGGSGIGLTIVRRLVEAHGGDIWIESKPGAGTTVHFSLPAA